MATQNSSFVLSEKPEGGLGHKTETRTGTGGEGVVHITIEGPNLESVNIEQILHVSNQVIVCNFCPLYHIQLCLCFLLTSWSGC